MTDPHLLPERKPQPPRRTYHQTTPGMSKLEVEEHLAEAILDHLRNGYSQSDALAAVSATFETPIHQVQYQQLKRRDPNFARAVAEAIHESFADVKDELLEIARHPETPAKFKLDYVKFRQGEYERALDRTFTTEKLDQGFTPVVDVSSHLTQVAAIARAIDYDEVNGTELPHQAEASRVEPIAVADRGALRSGPAEVSGGDSPR